ncbi:MAG: PilZ domain-containing protein [Vicinamibacteria bacterium]
MKTILDLIGEFASLNDAKAQRGGRLEPDAERRFAELKDFYDLLMAHTGLAPRRVTRRFSAEDVFKKVTARERLRIPLETEMIFSAGGEFHAGLAVNLSRGGLFLSARHLLPVNSPVTIYLSSPDAIDHALIETPAKVVWVAERGISTSLLPPGMGVSFVAKKGLVESYLDAMVVDSLVRHLSGVDATLLAPEFIGRELVEI